MAKNNGEFRGDTAARLKNLEQRLESMHEENKENIQVITDEMKAHNQSDIMHFDTIEDKLDTINNKINRITGFASGVGAVVGLLAGLSSWFLGRGR